MSTFAHVLWDVFAWIGMLSVLTTLLLVGWGLVSPCPDRQSAPLSELGHLSAWERQMAETDALDVTEQWRRESP